MSKNVLDSFVAKTIQDHYPDAAHNYSIQQFVNQDDFGKGGFGGGSVYQVISNEGKLLCVVKVEDVDEEAKKFIDLLVPASNLLRQLPLIDLQLILPISAQITNVNGILQRFIATPAAQGKGIVTDLAALSRNEIPLESFIKTLQNVSQALAEFNTLLLKESPTLTPELQKIDDKVVEVFLLYLQEHPEWFSFDSKFFKEKFATLYHAAYKIPFQIGFIHGDSSITNIFYDAETNLTSLVDSMTIFRSISLKGEPTGNIAQEFANTRCSLQLYGTYYGLSKEILTSIDNTFTKSYPLPIPPEHNLLYSLHFWMAYLVVVYKVKQQKPLLAKSLENLLRYVINSLYSNLVGELNPKAQSRKEKNK